MTQRKQVKTALERIDDLEKRVPEFAREVEKAVNGQAQSMAQLSEVMGALIEIVGPNAVDAMIEENRARREQARVEAAKDALAKGIAAGTIVPAALVSTRSLIVADQKDKDGKVVDARIVYSQVKPEYQTKVLDQAPGFSFEFPDGGSFTIKEVYDVPLPPVPDSKDVPVEASEEAPAPSEG
jgi:hypothetical protein